MPPPLDMRRSQDLLVAVGDLFCETKQGLRYTISEPIRREILDRLLQLNFDRYAEEVAQGLHDKKKGKSKKKKAKTKNTQGQLNLHSAGWLKDEIFIESLSI
ncbi:MAG: hypothetical protein AAGE96_22580 [Cyanobacteria bacterium P01_G01_bin.19]